MSSLSERLTSIFMLTVGLRGVATSPSTRQATGRRRPVMTTDPITVNMLVVRRRVHRLGGRGWRSIGMGLHNLGRVSLLLLLLLLNGGIRGVLL